MNDDVAIKVENVSKSFKLPHQRIGSIKHLVTNPLHAKRSYEVQHALKNIDLEIKKGEFFGIVGRNGSGKSTLLKILAGIYQPSKGKVQVHGKLVPFIELGVGFNPELTGRENVYLNGALLGFSEKEIAGMYDDIVEFAELEKFMDQKLKNYSSGMQVRLAFSMATRSQADILLIDEVLAVGDADFQRKCYEYFKSLKKDKKTVIFVSHDMGAVREFCDSAMLIEASEKVLQGKSSDVSQEYSKLFLTDPSADGVLEIVDDVTNNKQRWGNGKVRVHTAKALVDESHVQVAVKLKVNADIEHVMYGIHVLSSAGQELTAVNNRMIGKPDLLELRAGTKVSMNWSIANIFNDGNYTINLTLVSESGVTYDWLEEATKFRVKRTERSTTDILPPIEIEYKITKR
jgi:ABC-2 type transport system ATP-binding protein